MTIPTEISVEQAVDAADQQLGEETFDEGFDSEEAQPEGQAAAPPAAEEDDLLSREVPTEKLSGYWKQKVSEGKKITFRDVMQGADDADEKIREQGRIANTAREESRVLRATMQSLQEIVQDLRNPKQPARQPSYADVGIHNPSEEILREGGPERFGQATANLGAQIAETKLDPRIQNIEQQIGAVGNKLEMMDVREASEQARANLGVDAAQWRRVGQWLWAGAATRMDLGGPKDSRAWEASWKGLSEAFPQPEPRRTVPEVGITRGNPSGSSRPVPVQKAGAQRPRVRGLVSAVMKEAMDAGLPEDVARALSEKTEAKLQRAERAGE